MRKIINDIKKHIILKQKPRVKKLGTEAIKSLKKTSFKTYLKYALYAFLGLIALLGAVIAFYIATVPLPDISNFDKRVISQSTKIYDRTGKVLLYDNHNTIRRTVVPLNEINPLIGKAAISIEDDQFYNHHGFRIKSLVRAVWSNVFKKSGPTQGGSTITQQIVKNTLLTSERTFNRKIKEVIIAIRLERKLSKDELLEIYLNEAPYSGNVYGVEEASQVYFKKKSSEVTLAEASYLASIPQAPSRYDPNGPNKADLDDRAHYVLKRMKEFNYITEDEYQTALNEKVVFVAKAQSAIKAPHFAFYLRDYLEKKYGADMVDKEGLKVISTLDFDLQSYAEDEALKEALKNEKEYNGKNIALVAIDPQNGQILSMIGSRDFFDKNIDGQFNVANSPRQPGSSFKPFAYATGFKKGLRPETVLFDTFTEFNANCTPEGKGTGCYSPDNFDSKWKGPMALRNALAESRNIPAVKVLYLAGVDDTIATARSMGVTGLTNSKDYGLSLVLGAGEVKLVDMASAYGTFATNGIHHETTGILRVEDRTGKVLEEYKEDAGEQVLPDYVASAITQILSDDNLRAPTFGRGSSLAVPGYSVAVKTGTTNSNRDAWIVGYNPRIAVGVWSGNNDNTTMKKGGAQVSGPLFNRVMLKYLSTAPDQGFTNIPFPDQGGAPVLRGLWQGGESFYIDKISGGQATDFTPPEARVEKVITNVHTILYWIDRDNILGPKPNNPTKDGQYKNWEAGIQKWWNNHGGAVTTASSIPLYYDNVHNANIIIPVTIIGLNDGQILESKTKINIGFNIDNQKVKRVDIYLDGKKINTINANPWEYIFDTEALKIKNGDHILKAIVFDDLLNQGETSVSFNYNDPQFVGPILNQEPVAQN